MQTLQEVNKMDKIIGWLLALSAVVTIYLSFFDSTRVFVG